MSQQFNSHQIVLNVALVDTLANRPVDRHVLLFLVRLECSEMYSDSSAITCTIMTVLQDVKLMPQEHYCLPLYREYITNTFSFLPVFGGSSSLPPKLQARPRLPNAEVAGAAAAFPLSRAPCIDSRSRLRKTDFARPHSHSLDQTCLDSGSWCPSSGSLTML